MTQTALKQSREDFTLLYNRLRQAPLNEEGTAFVRRALTGSMQWEKLAADQLVSLALTAQQHGLTTQAIHVLEWLNENHPQCESGWKLHFETLALLGLNEKAVRLKARAARYVPDERSSSWGMILPESHTTSLREDGVGEPFFALRRNEENIKLFMKLFRGREDAFARQWADRDRDRKGYVPVRRPMSPQDVEDHLSGRRTYGIYLLNEQDCVYTGVIDVDLIKQLREPAMFARQKAAVRRESIYLHQRIQELSRKYQLTCIGEISGGKGYHFWFPVKEPLPAALMRKTLTRLVHGLSQDISFFQLEIFPKQDKATGKGFGNLVKLPLGIHKGSGKPSWFVRAADRSREKQFDYLRTVMPAKPAVLEQLAQKHRRAKVMVHPRHAAWASEFPELAELETKCSMLGQLAASLRATRALSVREEKILLGTLSHLPRGRLLLHHLFAELPEYNRPLLDYRISRVRGSVLGCKRIHSLLEDSVADLPCRFDHPGYPHPLLHIEGFDQEEVPRAEKVENLKDALLQLQAAVKQVERFLQV